MYYGLTSTLAANAVNFVGMPCTDGPFPTDEAWAKLISTPPAPLTEEYVKCQNSKSKAFATALGLANSLLQAALTMCALLVLPLLIYAMEVFGYIRPVSKLGDEYDAEDKKLVIEELALQLLRVRDNDVRGLSQGGALDLLGRDLINTARETALLDSGEGEPSYASNLGQSAKLHSRVSARVFLDIDDAGVSEESLQKKHGGKADLGEVGHGVYDKRNNEILSGTNPMQNKNKDIHDQL